MMRVEAARRIFPRCWFNEKTTEAGRDALGYYHERRDENRSVGLGPEHDWSSHAADAFGYLAISYEEPPAAARRLPYSTDLSSSALGWPDSTAPSRAIYSARVAQKTRTR